MTDALQIDLVASRWRLPLQAPASIPESADVVIIGGGIVGVSTAWFLAKQGVSVALCEKGNIAGEQSGRNWGWVRVQGRDVRELPMMLESLRIWRGLSDEIGEDVGYRQGGCLFAASDERELSGFDAWLEIAKQHDLDSRIIKGDELRTQVRGNSVEWPGALFTASDGRAEPHRATAALARAATGRGASMLTACAVRGIDIEAGRVAGVVTEHGRIRTPSVLCAAGAWSGLFCRSLGVMIPQLKVRGTVVRTASGPDVLNGNLFDRRLGIRRRVDGGYTVAPGSILDHAITPSSFRHFFKYLPALMQDIGIVKLSLGRDFVDEWRTPKSWDLGKPSPFESTRVLDPEPNRRAVRKLRKDLDSVFPDFRGVDFVESWAGTIEAMPDIVPVIDEVSAIPGFHIATGFSGHGFGIGPGAGKVIAAMLTGTSCAIDLKPLRLARFSDGSPIRPQASI